MSFTDRLNTGQVQYILDKLNISYSTKSDLGDWQTISSPFREDKKPSFGLDIHTGAWKDHGTGKKGDLVDLVKEVRNKSTEQAMNWIKGNLGLSDEYFKTTSNRSSYGQAFQFYSNGNTKIKPVKNFEVAAMQSKPATSKKDPSKRLEDESHEIIHVLESYDLINKSILLKYNCGIIEKYGEDWLSIPYKTGTQLYRRENGDKIIRMLKGSKPSDSFFGLSRIEGHSNLLIAKSPREAMMLHQRYNDILDVMSIASGEVSSLTNKQAKKLKTAAQDASVVRVIFDCDTSQSLDTTKKFTQKVAKILPNQTVVEYINVWSLTDKRCKDLNDYFKKISDLEKAYKSILSKGTEIKKRKTAPKDIFNSLLDVESAKPHSDEVYKNLPGCLKEITSLFEEDYHRDVFLNSSLPVLAGHLTKVRIPHKDCDYSPDLYTMVIAKPGSGKGVADKARDLGKVLNDYLVNESKEDKAKWKSLSKAKRDQTPEPPLKQLFLPGNSSSRALYDFLKNNDSKGLIFETEIDTLVNVSRQDWGDFTDIIRKGFHHEPISIQRKEEEMYIDQPQLSIFMSGTFDQFRKLFDSAENGHFSRYALYTFEAPLDWISHRPTEKTKNLNSLIENLSQKLFSIYEMLDDKEKPLKIYLKDRHWDSIDDTFREKMNRLEQEQMSRYLQSNNQRAAIIALRISAILCILRKVDQFGLDILDQDSLTISDQDLRAALYLANNFFDHATRLFQILPNSDQKHSKGIKFESFYMRLPDEFETKQAYYIGIDLGVTDRTVRNYLRTFLDNGSLEKIERGKYQKV